jgi:hypothetical protein
MTREEKIEALTDITINYLGRKLAEAGLETDDLHLYRTIVRRQFEKLDDTRMRYIDEGIIERLSDGNLIEVFVPIDFTPLLNIAESTKKVTGRGKTGNQLYN